MVTGMGGIRNELWAFDGRRRRESHRRTHQESNGKRQGNGKKRVAGTPGHALGGDGGYLGEIIFHYESTDTPDVVETPTASA